MTLMPVYGATFITQQQKWAVNVATMQILLVQNIQCRQGNIMYNGGTGKYRSNSRTGGSKKGTDEYTIALHPWCLMNYTIRNLLNGAMAYY